MSPGVGSSVVVAFRSPSHHSGRVSSLVPKTSFCSLISGAVYNAQNPQSFVRLSHGRPCDWLPWAGWCELHKSIIHPAGWLLARESCSAKSDNDRIESGALFVFVLCLVGAADSDPHMYNDTLYIWLLVCDVGSVKGPVPAGEGVARQ